MSGAAGNGKDEGRDTRPLTDHAQFAGSLLVNAPGMSGFGCDGSPAVPARQAPNAMSNSAGEFKCFARAPLQPDCDLHQVGQEDFSDGESATAASLVSTRKTNVS
jgi:hypothetical protein